MEEEIEKYYTLVTYLHVLLDIIYILGFLFGHI